MKDSFLMRGEWERHMELLTMEQRGQLLTAIFAYQNREEATDCDPMAQLAFSFMKPFFEECAARYAEKVRTNQENGKLGGRPRNPNNPVGFPETQQKPSKAKKPVSGSVTGSVTGSVSLEGEDSARRGRFTPPSLAEVSAYVSERHSRVVPQEWIDFYAANGWMVGKAPMKDWKAACRNAEKWERWDKLPNGKSGASAPGEADRRVREDMERMRKFMREQGNLEATP